VTTCGVALGMLLRDDCLLRGCGGGRLANTAVGYWRVRASAVVCRVGRSFWEVVKVTVDL